MSSTHISLHYHFVFSTRNRRPWIRESWEERLHSYIGGIVRGLNGVAQAIGGADDHVHILASLRPTHRVSDVLRDIKSCSCDWVHRAIGNAMFSWQDGYGGFTVGKAEIEALKKYVRGQREHHKKRTFQEEYLELLRQSGIDFDERYLW